MRRIIAVASLLVLLAGLGCTPGEEEPEQPVFEFENLLQNSKWELYGYKDANLTGVLPLTDTLEFFATPDYRYNHLPQKYNVYNKGTSNQAVWLQLNDTRFGTVSGIVQIASVNNGTILGETFSRATDEVGWQLWFRKI